MADHPSRPPKGKAEYDEGPSAVRRFSDALGKMLSVPKAEVDKREAAWKQARARKKKRAAG
jgi:hypothetical protein